MSNIPGSFVDGVLTGSDDALHSAVLEMSMGDQSLDGLVPFGRAEDISESRGHMIGARLGARVYPTVSFTATLAAPNSAFNALCMGVTAGFVSTLADIGDLVGIDLSYSYFYGAESRTILMEDCVLSGLGLKEGSPGDTVSYAFTIRGPVKLDGVTYISAR